MKSLLLTWHVIDLTEERDRFVHLWSYRRDRPTRCIGNINGGDSSNELRRLFPIESSLSFVELLSNCSLIDVGVSTRVFLVFFLDLDRAPNTGCVINARWWLGMKRSVLLICDDDNIEFFQSYVSDPQAMIETDPASSPSNEMCAIFISKWNEWGERM